ncbi:MAG: hypothetical protein C4519_00195 [Desulfobacteraceae bacterium]|nr:MAG: hypothetical protein C4519_00195 [Desulfobacteraceae bacterium]
MTWVVSQHVWFRFVRRPTLVFLPVENLFKNEKLYSRAPAAVNTYPKKKIGPFSMAVMLFRVQRERIPQ